jgi:hypothetical protein
MEPVGMNFGHCHKDRRRYDRISSSLIRVTRAWPSGAKAGNSAHSGMSSLSGTLASASRSRSGDTPASTSLRPCT